MSLLPIVLLFAISSYLLYISYGKYYKAQELKSIVINNRILNRVLNEIGKERGLSVAYIATHDKAVKKRLDRQRLETDNEIEKAREEMIPIYGNSLLSGLSQSKT